MYLIKCGKFYLAGKRIYRHPTDKAKVISLWSSKLRDAKRIEYPELAEYLLRKINNPDARIICGR
jgi:hypothetical protein